jgi:DNA-binding FadR family transcriptional regulator
MNSIVGSKTIYSELLEEINKGKYKPLGPFPSETALCRRFKVSRGTVRRAKVMLMADGLLSACRGSGTIVLPRGDNRAIRVVVSGSRDTDILRHIAQAVYSLAERDGRGVALGDALCEDAAAYDRLLQQMEGDEYAPVEICLSAPHVVQKSTHEEQGRVRCI